MYNEHMIATAGDNQTLVLLNNADHILSIYRDEDGWDLVRSFIGDVQGGSLCINYDGTVIALGDDSRNVVYIYRLIDEDWELQHSLRSDLNDVRFGFGVSIDGDGKTLVVGSYGDKHTEGSLQIFTLDATKYPTCQFSIVNRITNMELQIAGSQTITDYETVISKWVGYTNAISNDGLVVAVGAYELDAKGRIKMCEVTVYRYTDTGWCKEAILTPTSKAYSCNYGLAIAINQNGSMIVVGDHIDYCSLSSLYVFNEYTQTAKLDLPNIGSSFNIAINQTGEQISVTDHTVVCVFNNLVPVNPSSLRIADTDLNNVLETVV